MVQAPVVAPTTAVSVMPKSLGDLYDPLGAHMDDPLDPEGLFQTGTMNPFPGAGASADIFRFVLNTNAVGRRIRVGLLVDNLDLVFDRLRDAHWALREVLSANNGLALIGASSTFVQDTFAYGSPFYDFFNVHSIV